MPRTEPAADAVTEERVREIFRRARKATEKERAKLLLSEQVPQEVYDMVLR